MHCILLQVTLILYFYVGPFIHLKFTLTKYWGRVMPPKWWHTSFLNLLPLTRTINSYPKTRHHRENPRTQDWGWRIPHTQTSETEVDCIGGVREVTACWLYCPLPRTVQHHGERWFLSLQFLQWKRERKREQPALPPPQHCMSLCEHPYSHPIPLELQGSATGNITMTENEGGAYNNQHMDVGRPSSYWQCPKSNLNQWLCSSIELS